MAATKLEEGRRPNFQEPTFSLASNSRQIDPQDKNDPTVLVD